MRLCEREAHRPAGIGVEPLVDEHLRGRDREREGGEREIKAAEPERGKAEQKAGDEAHHAGQRNRRPVRQAEFRHQDRRPVAADGEEGAVAERYLAVEAGQKIEAEQRDGEDEHLRALIEVVARSDEREDERDHSDRDGDKGAERAVGVGHRHTLATSRRPNSPDGRQTRTAMMIASATESLTSSPTT